MFGVLSAGSNVGRIVRAKRNMKIANSSQIKIFFHRFFILIHCFIYFWRRSDGGICTSLSLKPLREEEYLFSDGSKREVQMAGYWPSSFFLRFTELGFLSVHKNAREQRG